jgi:REP element-mobilizing transposase RayT
VCLFGKIKNDKMILNDIGKIVDKEWKRTAQLRQNIVLDEYIVMPNHIHGIIALNDKHDGRGTMHRAPTYEQFGKPVPGSIPTIMRAFKSAVTKNINKIRNTCGRPIWQRNYWEHVIRDANDLNRIRAYIKNNPSKWTNSI